MSFLLYVVQHFATKGQFIAIERFLKANILGLGSNKTCREVIISDLALVSSPEVACGFTYDSKHRETHVALMSYGKLLMFLIFVVLS